MHDANREDDMRYIDALSELWAHTKLRDARGMIVAGLIQLILAELELLNKKVPRNEYIKTLIRESFNVPTKS